MANAIDFIASVYNTLANAFNMGGSPPPNIFLQMAWPGIPINSDDLKNNSGQYDKLLAEELFTSLANIAPTLSKSKFENSAYYIDDLYDIILSSARPNGIPDTDLGTNPMFKLFADAQYEFGQYVRGSNVDPLEIYHPCKATPTNWYDETAAAFWTKVTIESNKIKPVDLTDKSSPFIRSNGLKLIEGGLIKMKSPNAIIEPIKSRMNNIITSNKLAVANKYNTKIYTTTPSLFQLNTEKVFKELDTPMANKTYEMLNNKFKEKLLTANTLTKIKRPIPINSFVKNEKLIKNVKIQDINSDQLLIKPNIYSAKNSIFLNDLLIKDLPTQNSIGADSFGISFNFCRVNIDRPWLNLALLSMPGWNIYGGTQGQYSTGTAENNPGIFPMLTTSFVLISNVNITANWSVTDKENLASAVSFGPFDIRNSTFNQNKLEIKGIQLIGCFSRLTPVLAPESAPA
ncbi:MAG: hypothetical protein IPM34_06965 [Saprospiraceae bacterium]|nr:hypothetical protein [Saprospiraceae bacterium]